MNYFDLLVGAFAILAVIAVYQMRPCTLILAGNNLMVARALSGIYRAGPPGTYWYVPATLFAQDNLATAATVLSITLGAMVACSFLFFRKRVRIGTDAPAVPRWLLVGVGCYLLLYAGAKNTILTGGYGTEADIRYNLELAGGHAFLLSFVLYELARRRLIFAISARNAFAIVFAIFLIIGYAKGSTGLTTGYLVVAAILLVPHAGSGRRLTNMARVCGVLLGVLVLSFAVRGVRSRLAAEGTSAVSSFWDNVLAMEESRDETGEGSTESTTNAGQSAVQMLMGTNLYDTGHSREWRSIYNVVEYTFIPSFFVEWFGWKRSIEPAWELRNYYIHGGGINLLGELYWNGGYLCVVIMTIALALFCTVVDIRCRGSAFWLIMMAQFAPAFLMGYGYGFPQVARGAINALLAVVGYRILVMVRGAPETTLQRPVHAAAGNAAIT